MSYLSDYEKRMLKNREENKKILASLGLDKPFFPVLNTQRKVPTKAGIKRKRKEDEKPRKAHRSSADSLQTRDLAQSSEDDWQKYGRRRSGRLMGKEPGDFQGLSFEEEAEEEEEKTKRIPRNRENAFGPIPGIEVGKVWSTRLECSADGIHRPTVAGIHGNASEGCYSLALSGGYEDDIDYGECFTYTGEGWQLSRNEWRANGGRDLKGTKSNPKNLRTAPQSKDQTLTRGNLALTKNVEKGLPVRVIRGYKLDSPFAPEEGYRYDGLYTVEKYWQSVGLSGFMVYKFALKRADNQPPAVWHSIDNEDESVVEGDPEVLVGDSTVSESKSPSKDNKDHENSAVVHDDGEGNDADHGEEKMTSEYDANVNDENEKNTSENNENEKCEDEKRKEKNATENGVDQNGADMCYTRQDDENTTDVNTNSHENDELKNDQSNQDGDEYLPAGSVCEDDHNMNTTSSQQDSSAEHSNAKAIQDENNDVNHVTDATRQEDSSEQTSVITAQDENNDDNDANHVTDATRQEDSSEQTSVITAQDENNDDNDANHVTDATRQEDSSEQTSVMTAQDENNDDNDANHVTDATRQEDSSEQTSVITAQDENDADENHVIKAKRLEANSNEQRQ